MWVRYQVNGVFTALDKVQSEVGVILILCSTRDNLEKARIEVSEYNPELTYKKCDDTFLGEQTIIKLYKADTYIQNKYYLAGQYKTIYVDTNVEAALGKVLVRLR